VPVDPTHVIGEILGEPAAEMCKPVNVGYQCPFINSECTKRSQGIEGPYPVCSVWRWSGRKRDAAPKNLVCVCPRRFYQVDFLHDVLRRCWPGQPPNNPQYVHEVTMGNFGTVDFVIADVLADGHVREFISVELQAIDITGSCLPAYQAAIASEQLVAKPSYGFNYANVYKRFVTQLIGKGYFHHHWETKIVAVVQDIVFRDFMQRAPFPELSMDQSNVVFMSYRFQPDESTGQRRMKLVLDRVYPTHHSNLQNAVLYKTPPSKSEFCERITRQLRGGG
jgi:hypothetical protein